ncbi:hypothetical protein [Foetidibacter luteolus]|uniref:hypothetical protein n=1 Tax=Foetidibacter luteolus TaxID=2608880 RepID=UPI00129BB983|nr:hypothetical protein [Foetidibacter luteolus]
MENLVVIFWGFHRQEHFATPVPAFHCNSSPSALRYGGCGVSVSIRQPLGSGIAMRLCWRGSNNRTRRLHTKPCLSLEVIIKIADTLQLSIDYLVGKTAVQLDKTKLKRLQDILKLSEENR